MSFKLYGGSPTAETSASAAITTNASTYVTITITANAWLVYSGSYVQSSGVVAKATGNGSSLGTKTVFGNGTYHSGTGVASTTFSFNVSKGSSSKSVSWYVGFHSYVDGTDLGEKQSSSGTITVPALTTYTVSYDANGGSGAPSSQTKYQGQALTISSTIPTRDGYEFAGWATSANATGVAYFAGGSYTTDASATLYAVWTVNSTFNSTCTIAYNANGGTGAPSSQNHIYATTSKISGAKPARDGYAFLGWSLKSYSTTATWIANGRFTYNDFANGDTITLYAVWKKVKRRWIKLPDGVSSVQSIYVKVPDGSSLKDVYFRVEDTYLTASGSTMLMDSSGNYITVKDG